MCLFRDGQAACGSLKHVLPNGDQLLRLIHYYVVLVPTTRMREIRVPKTVLLLSLIPVSLS